MLALSTAWSPGETSSLAKIFAESRKIGFDNFELGISTARFNFNDVELARSGGATFVSLHAVCSIREIPKPNQRGDWVGSPDESHRRQGVELVKETLRIAREVGAKAIVLHGGTLPLYGARTFQENLAWRISEGTPGWPRQKELDNFLAARANEVPARLDALIKSCRELCEYAPDILICLENRVQIHEIPLGDEFEQVFQAVGLPNLRYWHDSGHATIMEKLGVVRQAEMLEKYSRRLAGMHIHDVKGFRDHLPPGAGDFDFIALKPYARPDVIKVMEMGTNLRPEAIQAGAKLLAEKYSIE